MGKLVYIMGKSGTGKTRSLRDIPADRFGLVNPEGKDLPFGKDSPAFQVERVVCDKSADIVQAIKAYARKYAIVVVDDFQTVMTNEYMRRASESGYQKWTDIGKHVWEIAEAAKDIPEDVILYVLCHTEENDNGGEKIKTLGKLLDQTVVLESKATIVLKTGVEDGRYFFCTQNNGKDTVKSPEGMFPSYAVRNDLLYVDDCIRSYYGLPGSKTDAEIAEEHAEVAMDVKPPAARKSRKKEKEEKPAATAKRTREQVQEDNGKKLQDYVEAQNEAIAEAAGDLEELPFTEASAAMDAVPAPELDAVPRRTRRARTEEGDTYYHIPETGDYMMRHAGEQAPEGGVAITEREYHDAVVAIAQKVWDGPNAAMNPPEARTRRRRVRA